MHEDTLRHGPVGFERPQLVKSTGELKGAWISDSILLQEVGDVITKTHRCVAFPNLYQHQVQPFHLEDPTKPGHRKILVFFLVDPTQRVPSATDVAPQQREWVAEAMQGAGASSALTRLPVEILMMISEVNDGTMTRTEAEEYREKLMAERTVFVDENTDGYFGMVRTCFYLVFTMKLTLSKRSFRNSICGGFLIFGLAYSETSSLREWSTVNIETGSTLANWTK